MTILSSRVPLFKPAGGCVKLLGVAHDEALEKLRTTGRPFVTVKFAQTLDGRIATRTGDSKWISGEPARRFAHQLRAEHDAIMVGIGTVLADDPRLTVRLVEGRDPVRVIVDSRLRTPLTAHLLSSGTGRTLIVCGEDVESARVDELRQRGVEVLKLPASARTESTQGSIDLGKLLESLGRNGVASVLVEGGSRIITSLLAGRLADRLVVAVAPLIAGMGVDAIGDLGIVKLSDAIRLSSVEVRELGDDVVFDARL
jgi:riboflavin-specific deaminase-like protein